METSQKIKVCARIGQFAFLFYCCLDFQRQLSMYNATEHYRTATELILAVVCLNLLTLCSEAIVRIIGYFAEHLDK